MEEKNYTGAVPDHKRGDAISAEATREFATGAAAGAFFAKAAQRLLDVNHWQEYAGEALARFILSDRMGNPLTGPAQKGLLLKIDIPGPGTDEGFDWVRIEEIEKVTSTDVESIALRVRPVSAPDSDDAEPTHFYDKQSTSTFTLTREHARITAAIYDRNIAANSEADSIFDKVRNAITGFAGKKVFSKIQWQALADGLVK